MAVSNLQLAHVPSMLCICVYASVALHGAGCESTVLYLRSPTGGAMVGNASELALLVEDPIAVGVLSSAPVSPGALVSTPAVRLLVSPGASLQCTCVCWCRGDFVPI